VRNVTLAGSGIFTDTDSEKAVQNKALNNSIDNYEVLFESGDKFTGAFQVSRLEYAGDHNGERTYSVTLESSGQVSFVEA